MTTTVEQTTHQDHLHIARTTDEVEALRDLRQQVSWPRVEADLDFYLTILGARPNARPYAVALERSGEPAAMAAARFEAAPLATKFGYREVYCPTVRSLTVGYGGVVSPDPSVAPELLGALMQPLASDEADILAFRALECGSPLHPAAVEAAGVMRRQHFTEPRKHWRLVLPESFDAFLAGVSRSTRESVKRYGKRLERTFGDELALEVLREPGQLDRIVRDLDRVAATTYQRGLGVAFSDDPEHRERVRLGLERGWFRAYVLYVRGEPVAFWPGYAYGGIFYVGIPGYDPAYAEHRVVNYVQARLIEDLRADPSVYILDFGLGDAEYKRRFGNDSWEEQDVVLFAPRFRAVRINTMRTAILGLDRAAKSVLSRSGLSNRVKKHWRHRLRPTQHGAS